jgi:hypothetical protein
MRRSFGLVVLAPALSIMAGHSGSAQQPISVQNLLSQDFAVVGAITSPAGPGLFLKKADKLFLCFVTETPQSGAVTTKYCKPVE